MFFLFIIIILLILVIAIFTSKFTIEVKNFKLDTQQPKNKKINKDKDIYLSIFIFKKIKVFKKNLNDIKLKKQDIDIKSLENKGWKIDYSEIFNYISIEQIDLNAQIGTENAALTAILTGVISSVIGIILKKPKFDIIPVFSNENFLKIKLDCIISIYLMQYIYKLVFNKNKKVEV